MSNSEGRPKPIVTDSDSESSDPDRGQVRESKQKPAFRVGQAVYIRASGQSVREGPYVVERVLDDKTYTLCFDENKATAKEGRAFKEEELEL